MEVAIANASQVGTLQLFQLTINGGIFIDAYEPLESGDTVAMPYGLYDNEIGPKTGSLLFEPKKPDHKAFHHLAVVFHPRVPRPMLVSLMLPSMYSIGAVGLDVIVNEDTCFVLVSLTPTNERSLVKKFNDQLFLIPRTESTGGENATGPNDGADATALALWTLEVRPELLICPKEGRFLQIQSGVGLTVTLPQSPPPHQLELQRPTQLFPAREGIDEDDVLCQLSYCCCEYKCALAPHVSHRRHQTITDDLEGLSGKKEVLTSSFFIF